MPGELAVFLEYTKRAADCEETGADDGFVRQIEEKIRSIKRDRDMEERYMQLELLLQEKKEEGREEEKENTRKERERADSEKERADTEKKRADEAEERVKELEKIIKAQNLKI